MDDGAHLRQKDGAVKVESRCLYETVLFNETRVESLGTRESRRAQVSGEHGRISNRVVKREGPVILEHRSRHSGRSLRPYLTARTVVSKRFRQSEPMHAQRQSTRLWLFDSSATAALFRRTAVATERRMA